MPTRFVCCLVLLVLTGSLAAAAQTTAPPPPRLTLGLSTASRTTYLQRAPLPADDRGYLGSTATYQAPSGFIGSVYLNHSYNFQTLGEPFINYAELMAGWQATGDGDTYWTVQYTRLAAYGESALVQASLRNDFSASVTQFFDLLTASVSADLFVGGRPDFVLTLDLSHGFELPVPGETTALTLEPTVEFAVGSQRFYTASLGRTTLVKKRRATSIFTEPDAPGFSALGYTLSAPLTFETGRLRVVATPSYLMPLNVPRGGADAAFFYFTLGLSRTFW